jgi:hypothetical protein
VKIQFAVRALRDRRIVLKLKWPERFRLDLVIGLDNDKTRLRLALSLLLLVLVVAVGSTVHDVRRTADRERGERSELIQDLSRTANVLLVAEDTRISGMMERCASNCGRRVYGPSRRPSMHSV